MSWRHRLPDYLHVGGSSGFLLSSSYWVEMRADQRAATIPRKIRTSEARCCFDGGGR